MTDKQRKWMKVTISLLLCLAVVGSGAALIWLGIAVRSAPSEAKAKDAPPEARRPNVEVQVLQSRTVEDRITLTGSIDPWESVMLSSEGMGKIEWRGAEVGDRVTAGQELFRIDVKTIRAQLAQAQAQHKLAEQELDRIQRLLKRGAGTAQDLDSATANRDVAASTLRLAEIQLEKSGLRAPFDGVIDHVMREQGEFVDVGAPLLRVVQVHKVKVRVGIPERDITHFAVGDPVTVRLDALQGRSFAGRIYRIATSADLATHTFPTEIELDNAAGDFKPGMIARVDLVRKAYPDSLMIPLFTAILLDEGRVAFVEEDGMAQMRPIEVGIVQGSEVQVTKGLNPGDRLIVKGQYDVRPGEPLSVQRVHE